MRKKLENILNATVSLRSLPKIDKIRENRKIAIRKKK